MVEVEYIIKRLKKIDPEKESVYNNGYVRLYSFKVAGTEEKDCKISDIEEKVLDKAS